MCATAKTGSSGNLPIVISQWAPILLTDWWQHSKPGLHSALWDQLAANLPPFKHAALAVPRGLHMLFPFQAPLESGMEKYRSEIRCKKDLQFAFGGCLIDGINLMSYRLNMFIIWQKASIVFNYLKVICCIFFLVPTKTERIQLLLIKGQERQKMLSSEKHQNIGLCMVTHYSLS